MTTVTTMTTLGRALLPLLATYLVHSTLLLGAAWLSGRFVLRGDAWRETLWKAALVGALATSLVAQALPWTPVRVTLPRMAEAVLPPVGAGRVGGGPAGPRPSDPRGAPSDPGATDARASAGRQEAGAATGGVAGGAAGVPAGGAAGVPVGDAAGVPVGDAAPTVGDAAGDAAGTPPGEAAGVAAGVGAGVAAGVGAGVAAGVGAGIAAAGGASGEIGRADSSIPAAEATRSDATTPGDLSIRAAWPGLVLASWAAVGVLLLARLLGRRWRLARLLRGRRRITEGRLPPMLAELRRAAGVWTPIRLTSTPAISSPLVLGRGEICVPERFLSELGPDEQRAALAHELAHVARKDPAWLLFAMVMERVFFFQPLHRAARRGLRETAEYLADSWAVRVSGGRLDLARCLAEVASWVCPAEEPKLAETLAMTEGGSPLLGRVRRLLASEVQPPEPGAGLRAASAVLLVAAAAALAPAVTAQDGSRSSAPSAQVGSGSSTTSAEVATRTSTPSTEVASPASPPVERDASRTSTAIDRDATRTSPPVEQDASLTSMPIEAEPSRTSTASRDQELTVVRAPDGGDLPTRMAWAAERASARGTGPYWIAWAAPSALTMDMHVSLDSRNGMSIQVTDEPHPELRFMGGGGAAASVLGVLGEIGYADDGYDVLVLARLGAPAGTVDRLAARSPLMPLRLEAPVYWLGRTGADESLSWHERLFETAADPDVREAALEVAALHAGPEAAGFLRGLAATRDVPREAREEAVEGLAFHPDDESLDLLVRLAEDDPDRVLRTEAVETLGELRHPDAADALRGFLRAADAEVRAEALEGLTEQVADTALAAMLVQVALNDPAPDLRREAVEHIGELPSAEAVPALQRLVSDSSDPDVRREVAEQLGDVGTPEALEALDGIVSASPDRDVLLEAVEAIADGFPADLARPRLEAISRDHGSVEVRREAMDELMDLHVAEGSGEVLLEMALGDQDPDLRDDAVERIAELSAAEAVPLLRRVAFESGDDDAERQAAESLGEVGTAEALAVLDEIIERDLGEDVSVEAVEAIADGFSRELALPRLQRIVTEHPSIRVRREALDRLADLGG